MEPDTSNSELIAVQLRHTVDLLRFEIQSLRAQLEHQNQLYARRLDDLEACQTDHETRLRTVQDSATTTILLDDIRIAEISPTAP